MDGLVTAAPATINHSNTWIYELRSRAGAQRSGGVMVLSDVCWGQNPLVLGHHRAGLEGRNCTVQGLMDSGHVWMLGRENAVSSEHASAEPPQPAAVLMCKTPAATPSVLCVLSLKDKLPPASAPTQVPPGCTPQGLLTLPCS